MVPKNLILVTFVAFITFTCNSVNGNIEPLTRVNQNFDKNSFTSQENGARILQKYVNEIFPVEDSKFKNILLQSEPEIFESVNPTCAQHVTAWLNEFGSSEPSFWALQMIDAWGKIPEGILRGHFAIPGDFDECLGIRANAVNISGQLSDFKGRYCYTNLPLPGLPLPFTLGTCYPSSCSKEDIAILQSSALGALNITTSQQGCWTDDPPKLTTEDKSMISILAVLVALCSVGTAIDLMLNHEDSKASDKKGLGIQCLVAFSVYRNTMKWLSTKTTGGDNFGCIHGLRFLSTCWVVAGHTWLMMTMQPTWNMFDLLTVHEGRWTILAIINGTVSVDTFFTMSGLLFAFNLLKMLEKSRGKFNVPMFYLHRYLRLTPTYALLVGIMATWFVYLGNGPMWTQMEFAADACQRNWWHNLLYINNLIDYGLTDAACHGETWYLSNDMQFFIVSPLLIYPLWRWKKIGMACMTLATAASVAVPFVIHYNSELLPTLLPFDARSMDFMYKSYQKPWMRIGPYLVGLWAGYLLFNFSNKKLRLQLPIWAVIGGWCISTGTALAIIFGIYPWFDMGADIPNLEAAFYAGFHRFAWGVVISWIIIACTQGYGGFVNKFLSWKVFMPLGRLTFCVYLISFQLQGLFHGRVRQAVSYDAYTATNLFFSHMVMSCLVGFVCCITMESPFIVLEKIIFGGGSKSSNEAKNQPQLDAKVVSNNEV